MHDRDKETEQLNNDELAECKSLSRDAETGSFTLEDILAEYGTRRSTQRSAVPVSAPPPAPPRTPAGGGLSRTSRSAPGGGAGGGPFEADGPVEGGRRHPGGRGGRRRDRPGGGLSGGGERTVRLSQGHHPEGRPLCRPDVPGVGAYGSRGGPPPGGAHSGHRPGGAPEPPRPDPQAPEAGAASPRPAAPGAGPHLRQGAEGDAPADGPGLSAGRRRPVPAGCSPPRASTGCPRWLAIRSRSGSPPDCLAWGRFSLWMCFGRASGAPSGGGWRWTPWPPCRSCSPWPTP